MGFEVYMRFREEMVASLLTAGADPTTGTSGPTDRQTDRVGSSWQRVAIMSKATVAETRLKTNAFLRHNSDLQESTVSANLV